jgi:ABC-type uncharacterized transport system substrate-binding protein
VAPLESAIQQPPRLQLGYGLSAATYVDRILRGAKPAELPVQFPTKFEMVVNHKTAKTVGLVVPQSIVLRATGKARS